MDGPTRIVGIYELALLHMSLNGAYALVQVLTHLGLARSAGVGTERWLVPADLTDEDLVTMASAGLRLKGDA